MTFPKLAIPLMSACLLSVFLTGCASTPSATDPLLLGSPTPVALFDSDEEALAVAGQAYSDYLNAAGYVLENDQRDLEPLYATTTGDLRRQELESVEAVRKSGQTSTGVTRIVNSRLKQVQGHERNLADAVWAEFCVDVSDTQVFDRAGTLVTKPDRPLRLPFDAHFDAVDGNLVAASSDMAEEFDVCVF